MAVFAYGTLQFDDVMEAVTGRRFAGVPASLAGYRRSCLHARSYPGIVPDAGEKTDGRLYPEVDAEALAVLDAFEGTLYDRLALVVRTSTGEGVRAWAYVVVERQRYRVSPQSWDPELFLQQHGEKFIEGCRRFRKEGVAPK